MQVLGVAPKPIVKVVSDFREVSGRMINVKTKTELGLKFQLSNAKLAQRICKWASTCFHQNNLIVGKLTSMLIDTDKGHWK